MIAGKETISETHPGQVGSLSRGTYYIHIYIHIYSQTLIRMSKLSSHVFALQEESERL